MPVSGSVISFSDLQAIFGGLDPVNMDEYYLNASSGYTRGVVDIPNINSTISLNMFYGKSKPILTKLQTIYYALQPYLGEYKNTNFYEYILDGNSQYILGGGGYMYDVGNYGDGGNYTQIIADNVAGSTYFNNSTTYLDYSFTTETSISVNGKLATYLSLGYNRPLIMLGYSTTRANWGFQKVGSLGGGGIDSNFNVYTGQIVNGFTVYAWCRTVYDVRANASPTIGDLYFAIGDSSSTFYTTSMATLSDEYNYSGFSKMSMDCVNVLFGCMLLSKPGGAGAYISNTDCQRVLQNLTNILPGRNRSLQEIYSALQPYLNEYKNTNFYEYILDPVEEGYSSKYIVSGGDNMYDDGNYTYLSADATHIDGTILDYNTTTETSISVNGKLVSYLSLGYNRPLIMLARSSVRSNWGFRKGGKLIAQLGRTNTVFDVYTGQNVNGFTVYAWCRHLYNDDGPSIGDLYFAIGDSSSTFYSTSMITAYLEDVSDGFSRMSMDCVNVLFGCMLLSKPGGAGAYISNTDCQTVLQNLTYRLK